MNTQKDDTDNGVTVRWRQYLMDDLELLRHAHDMARRTKSDESRDVIYVAIGAINERLRVDIHYLGGLAAAW
jgi:hypothetical protein